MSKNSKDKSKMLVMAVEKGKLAEFKRLISEHVPLSVEGGDTLLVLAAKKGQLDIVKYMLLNELVNDPNDGHQALMCAAIWNHPRTTQVLSERFGSKVAINLLEKRVQERLETLQKTYQSPIRNPQEADKYPPFGNATKEYVDTYFSLTNNWDALQRLLKLDKKGIGRQTELGSFSI